MKIIDMKVGQAAYTQLGHRVLAVLCRRVDGWSVYVDAVPGETHAAEWEAVRESGDKQCEAMALAIVANLFHPGFDPAGCPYVD